MSRHINADDLIAKWYRTSVRGRTEFDQVIMNMPTIDLTDYVPKDFHDKTCEAMAKRYQEEIADMVSVVRCKECKWASPNKEGDYDCKCHIPIFRVDAEGYCYLADRKESE